MGRAGGVEFLFKVVEFLVTVVAVVAFGIFGSSETFVLAGDFCVAPVDFLYGKAFFKPLAALSNLNAR